MARPTSVDNLLIHYFVALATSEIRSLPCFTMHVSYPLATFGRDVQSYITFSLFFITGSLFIFLIFLTFFNSLKNCNKLKLWKTITFNLILMKEKIISNFTVELYNIAASFFITC